MNRSVYYLTGMDGRLDKGLGEAISARGYKVTGRELIGEFKKLEFRTKVDLIINDLVNNHWTKDSKVIANSFGAYLFLQAQAQMSPYIGNVILLSPIIGKFTDSNKGMGFIPPRAKKLEQLVSDGKFPVPLNCQIHVGSEDWQSGPENAKAFGIKTGIRVVIEQGSGHLLSVKYVSKLLDTFLQI
jgi:hypothetical protein